jgi:hypothetical protein
MFEYLAALCRSTRIRCLRQLAVGFVAVALGIHAAAAAGAADGVTPVSWAGLNWGLGVAADFDTGGTRVGDATIVNNIVRVKDTSANVGVSFVLEAHYFIRDFIFDFGHPALRGPGGCTAQAKAAAPLDYQAINCTELAHGPFVAIEVGGGTSAQPANNGPITGYALGWMVGLHHPKFDASGKPVPDNTSWNLGVGLRIDPKAQVLGDGFVANAPPPAGETAVRFKTEPRLGIMVMSSFSF